MSGQINKWTSERADEWTSGQVCSHNAVWAATAAGDADEPVRVFSPYSKQACRLDFLFLFDQAKRKENCHEHYPELKIINMNARLYDPVIGRFFSPDKFVANSSFTQDFNRYTYARNNPLMYTDPDGNKVLFFLFPTIGWSAQGGFSLGITAGLGIPGVFNVSANIGYNFSSNDFTASLGATAVFNTVYTAYSSQSGFSVGYTAGMTQFAGFPFSTNVATVGANYNITNNVISANISSFYWTQGQGWSFNPSVSAAVLPQHFTNMARGQGFRSNQEVYDRMMSGEATRKGNPYSCQDILNYFGLRGTYDPSITSPGATDERGRIFYGDGAFEGNYDRLALIAHHEFRHSQNVKSGKYKGIDLNDRSNVLTLNREDWDTYMYNYKNLGLYPSQESEIIGRINSYGWRAGIYYPGSSSFSPVWWHFIYRIPRLW